MERQAKLKPVLAIGELLWDLLPGGPVLGGAPAIFAMRLAALDVPVTFAGRVGDDDAGRNAVKQLDNLGVSRDFLQFDSRVPTGTVKVTLSATGNANYEIQTGAAGKLLRVAQRRSKFSGQASRERPFESLHQWPTQKLRHRIKRPGNLHRELARITGKDFVTSHS